MTKSRAVLATALGAMTPAFLVEAGAKAHVAPQTTADVQRSALKIAPSREAMKSGLLALSPAEKLHLAGDRIRLAKAKKKLKSSPKVAFSRNCVTSCKRCPDQCPIKNK